MTPAEEPRARNNPDPAEAISALREKAERWLVYPLNRDECLALVLIAERAEKAEARCVALAEGLERIAAHPHGGILGNIARRTLAAAGSSANPEESEPEGGAAIERANRVLSAVTQSHEVWRAQARSLARDVLYLTRKSGAGSSAEDTP